MSPLSDNATGGGDSDPSHIGLKYPYCKKAGSNSTRRKWRPWRVLKLTKAVKLRLPSRCLYRWPRQGSPMERLGCQTSFSWRQVCWMSVNQGDTPGLCRRRFFPRSCWAFQAETHSSLLVWFVLGLLHAKRSWMRILIALRTWRCARTRAI